jgi:hypothetical protein
MKSAWCVLFVAVLAACAISRTQTLLVSDYGYFLNGMKATELEQFEKKLRLQDPIALEACSCANTKLVTGAVAWLQGQGVKKISMTVIPGTEQRCGLCK